MANIDKKLLQKLSQLCRIHISEEEEKERVRDLEQIVQYVEQLQELDTKEFPPCHHVLPNMSNVMQEDEPSPTLPRENYLNNAPDQIGGMVRIPAWLKGVETE